MEDIKPVAPTKRKYKVRNVFPGKVFSKPEQQKIATQISKQLSLHKTAESAKNG